MSLYKSAEENEYYFRRVSVGVWNRGHSWRASVHPTLQTWNMTEYVFQPQGGASDLTLCDMTVIQGLWIMKSYSSFLITLFYITVPEICFNIYLNSKELQIYITVVLMLSLLH